MRYKPVSHEEFKKEAFKIPGILKEYNDLEEEFALISELIRARKISGKSQKDVAAIMKTTSSAISRIETCKGEKRHSPTIETLRKYAKAVGCKLSIKLIPEANYRHHVA